MDNSSVKKRNNQELFMQPFFQTKSERKGVMQFRYQGKLKRALFWCTLYVKLRLYSYFSDAFPMQFRVKPASFYALLLKIILVSGTEGETGLSENNRIPAFIWTTVSKFWCAKISICFGSGNNT